MVDKYIVYKETETPHGGKLQRLGELEVCCKTCRHKESVATKWTDSTTTYEESCGLSKKKECFSPDWKFNFYEPHLVESEASDDVK